MTDCETAKMFRDAGGMVAVMAVGAFFVLALVKMGLRFSWKDTPPTP